LKGSGKTTHRFDLFFLMALRFKRKDDEKERILESCRAQREETEKKEENISKERSDCMKKYRGEQTILLLLSMKENKR